MYIEDQLAELTRVIQAGFENLAEILRSNAASPVVLAAEQPTTQPTTQPPAPVVGPALITGLPNGQDRASELTFDQVNALAQEAARLKSPPIIIDLIRQHGAGRLAEMDPKHYPAFVAALEVLMRKGEAAL